MSRFIRSLQFAFVASLFVVLLVIIQPNAMVDREASQIVQCRNTLKLIGLALHNYHDDYGAFPPAFTVDENNRPLHSWRTLILPYMDQTPLFESIDLTKPWNDPVNAKAMATSLVMYRCVSSDMPPNHTSYLALNGEGLFFHGTSSRSLSTETNAVVAIMETPATFSVPWMSPNDADGVLLQQILASDKFPHTTGGLMSGENKFNALFGDGSVRSVTRGKDLSGFKAMVPAGRNSDDHETNL